MAAFGRGKQKDQEVKATLCYRKILSLKAERKRTREYKSSIVHEDFLDGELFCVHVMPHNNHSAVAVSWFRFLLL